jgi:uncharacterized protein (TIGR03435 family)
MTRLFAALLTTAVVASPAAQTDTRPAFAVATIKKNTTGDAGRSMRLQPGGRIVAVNQPLRQVIVFAYGLQPQQLAGGPAWLDTDRFDITAQAEGNISPTPPGGPPGPAQLMMQRLLAERFGLSVHTESRELPVYALTVARSDGRLGPRITPADRDCLALMTQAPGGVPVQAPRLPDGRPGCGAQRDASGRIMAGGTTMTMLSIQMLTGPAGRIVVDRTGLTGAYDFDLEFQIDQPAGAPTTGASTAVSERPSLFTALEEQLGLKLQPTRAPIDVTVIDRVSPPTEN